jgi:hypothetical protein
VYPSEGTHLTVDLAEALRNGERTRVDIRTIDIRSKSGIHAALEISAACGKELSIVRMESHTQDGGFKFLFQHFANPPIIGNFICANWNTFCTTCNGESQAIHGPLYIDSSAINTKNHKGWFP